MDTHDTINLRHALNDTLFFAFTVVSSTLLMADLLYFLGALCIYPQTLYNLRFFMAQRGPGACMYSGMSHEAFAD